MSSNQQHRPINAFFGLAIVLIVFSWASAQAASVFINEIHYDNTGKDTGEAIEIAGPSGTDLTGWSILRYNGNGGEQYDETTNLSGIIPDLKNGFGTLDFSIAGLQNGAPDGLALINSMNVIQFLSYEGSFIASGGDADGLMSVAIGVSEPSSTPIGHSLQLIGTGTVAGDFTWAAAKANSFGAVNAGQTFSGRVQQPVPEPSTLLLLGSGLASLSLWRWKHKQ